MIKDKNKEVYTSPITEALELRFEGVVCQSYGSNGAPGGDPGLNDDKFNYGGF